MKSVAQQPLEDQVMLTIFENIFDVPSFEAAIAASMPDQQKVDDINAQIKSTEKQLDTTSRDLEKLINLAMSGTLSPDTIRTREQAMIKTQQQLTATLAELNVILKCMPDTMQMKAEADTVRRQLLERYSGVDRLLEMTFEEKRELLHWLFDGKDETGAPYGIYVTKTERGQKASIDYFLYGRIIGLRTIGEDSDYITNTAAYKGVDKSYNISFRMQDAV
jgi:hypothetical protein